MSNLFFIDNSEKINLLGHIKETISLIDYPSPMLFSVLSRLSIVSFLRGKGVLDDIIDRQAIDIFKQLSIYTLKELRGYSGNSDKALEQLQKIVDRI